MTAITLPKLSDSMEQGTILTWLKGDGEHVEAGEDLVEVETDKATVTVQAEASGTLRVVAAEGASLAVGEVIAELGSGATPVTAAAEPVPVAASSAGTAATAPAAPPANGHVAVLDGAPRATPVARRAALALGVDLDGLTGSGPLGRIVRADVLARAGVVQEEPAPVPPARRPAPAPAAATASGTTRGDVEAVEPTRLQALIAARMTEAKATVPEFQVQTEVRMDAALDLRAHVKAAAPEGRAVPSLNDLVVKAVALALRDHPHANAAWRDGRFERYSRVNVGIAVATDGALVVPTIFDADQRGLGAIAAESRRLAEAVRDGSIAPNELEGATFTVSNLGMYGMTAITPVLNLPQAGILGVGAIRETLARHDGEIVDRRLMTLTLTCDHRILYGADAARLLARIREDLEEPLRLLL